MATPRFFHIALACRDPLSLERFYTKHFGFRRAQVFVLGDQQIVFLKSDTIYLELFQARLPAPVAPAAGDGPWYPGLRHLAFTVDDVDAKLAELGSEVRVTQMPLDFDDFIPGWRSAWVADPEGNILELTRGYLDEPESPPASRD